MPAAGVQCAELLAAGPLQADQPDCFRLAKYCRRCVPAETIDFWLLPAAAASKVCVYNAAQQEIIGPKTAAEHALTQDELASLAKGGLTFYAEGREFGASVRLQLVAAAESQTPKDELVLHVAPLLLLPDTAEPYRNMVVRLADGDYGTESQQYVRAFEQACAEAAPLVVRVEGETRRLTGTAEAQYETWRKLLKEIYRAETGYAQALEVGVEGRAQAESPR